VPRQRRRARSAAAHARPAAERGKETTGKEAAGDRAPAAALRLRLLDVDRLTHAWLPGVLCREEAMPVAWPRALSVSIDARTREASWTAAKISPDGLEERSDMARRTGLAVGLLLHARSPKVALRWRLEARLLVLLLSRLVLVLLVSARVRI
jgi:hypothetical protein